MTEIQERISETSDPRVDPRVQVPEIGQRNQIVNIDDDRIQSVEICCIWFTMHTFSHSTILRIIIRENMYFRLLPVYNSEKSTSFDAGTHPSIKKCLLPSQICLLCFGDHICFTDVRNLVE